MTTDVHHDLQPPESRFVTVDGVRMHYHKVSGPVDATPVIFTHGGGPGCTSWNNFRLSAAAFATHHPCYFVDLPQYGGSDMACVEGPFFSWHAAKLLGFMDALGIREELKDMARRIGTVGYCVLLPNLFWRDGGPSFDPALLPLRGPDPMMMRLNHAYSHARGLADTAALLALAERDPAIDARRVATIGWCMGGRHALKAAGAFPLAVRAMVSLHAGFQVTERPDSAHQALRACRAACYFGFAEGDPLSPEEHQRTLALTAARAGVDARFETYPGAEHGFTFPTRHCYHKPSAERAWERVFALFRRTLDR